MKLMLLVMATFVASLAQGGEFADVRKPCGLSLGMATEEAAKLRNAEGGICAEGWEVAITLGGKDSGKLYGVEVVRAKEEHGGNIQLRFDALKAEFAQALGTPSKESADTVCWLKGTVLHRLWYQNFGVKKNAATFHYALVDVVEHATRPRDVAARIGKVPEGEWFLVGDGVKK